MESNILKQPHSLVQCYRQVNIYALHRLTTFLQDLPNLCVPDSFMDIHNRSNCRNFK